MQPGREENRNRSTLIHVITLSIEIKIFQKTHQIQIYETKWTNVVQSIVHNTIYHFEACSVLCCSVLSSHGTYRKRKTHIDFVIKMELGQFSSRKNNTHKPTTTTKNSWKRREICVQNVVFDLNIQIHFMAKTTYNVYVVRSFQWGRQLSTTVTVYLTGWIEHEHAIGRGYTLFAVLYSVEQCMENIATKWW